MDQTTCCICHERAVPKNYLNGVAFIKDGQLVHYNCWGMNIIREIRAMARDIRAIQRRRGLNLPAPAA